MLKNKVLLAQLGLIITTLIWGCTFTIVKAALQDAPPYIFSAMRFGLAAMVCLIILHKNLLTISKNEFVGGLICGIFLFAGYSFQNFGLLYTTASKSAFVTGTCIIMVPIILVLFNMQVIKTRIWISVCIAILGLYILLDPRGGNVNRGDILTFGCALGFAIHILLQDHYIQKSRVMHLLFIQLVTVAILSTLFHEVFESPEIIWSNRLIGALLVTSLLATLVGIGIMVWAQKILSPSRTAIIFSMEPVFATLYAMTFANEYLSLMGWLGGILIVISVIYGETGRE